MTDRTLTIAWILAGATIALVGTASAEEGTAEQAASFHQRGIELYRADSYAEAIAQFLRAQELAPAPSNLFNISRCYERLGDAARAVEYLERYVADPALDPDRRERGQEELARLRGSGNEGGEVGIATTPPGALVFVDGRPQGSENVTPTTLELPSGRHLIEVRLEGLEPISREVEVSPGGTIQLVLDLSTGESGTGDSSGSDPDVPAPRLTWTAFGQIGIGGSIALYQTALGSAVLVGFDVGAGLNLGRPRLAARGVEVRPIRLEAMLGVYYQPAEGHLLEAIFTGRLGVALGALPVRIEGEVGIGLCYVSYASGRDAADYSLALVPAVSVSWQVLRWLEVALRPARIELLGLANDNVGFNLRLSMDVMVRFRY